MKKILPILFCFLVSVLAMPSLSLSAQAETASTPETKEDVRQSSVSQNEQINTIEKNYELLLAELEKNDFDPLTELKKERSYYQNLLTTASSDAQQTRIQNLISTLDELINAYRAPSTRNIIVNPEASFPIYFGAINTYFRSYNYVLSSELLLHMRSNKILDSYYFPEHGQLIKDSPEFTRCVNSTNMSGSGEFEDTGTVVQKDLYNSIHYFTYTKSRSNSRTITLADTYDYAPSDSGNIAGVAINLVYQMQQSGYLTPYKIQITATESKDLNISASNRYTELSSGLGPNESLEFNLTFGNSGNRIVQILGTCDSILEIYQNDTLVTHDDDDGYSLNALVSYNFTANIKYVAKVSFWKSYYGPSSPGDFKIVITPTYVYDTYENLPAKEVSSSFTSYTSNTQNMVRLSKLIPASTREYTIYTDKNSNEGYKDMYLYIVDPRSALPISSDFSQPSVYNDDGGGNLQAKITKKLEADIPYLLIVSTYNPTTTYGSYILYIS